MQISIRLREHERSYVALREDDASLIQRKLADVLPLSSTADPGRYVLKASSHVGVVHLSSGRTVVIEPKVRIETLFALLSAVYDPAKEILRDEPYPHTSVAALFEFVVAIFVRHVEDLIARGLLRSYQSRTEHLPAIRGRLLIAETVRQRPGLYDRHWCSVSHFTRDIAENRILKWAAFCLQSHRYQEIALSGRVRRVLRALRDVYLDAEARRLFAFVTYHRLNDPYRPALAMARLLLDHLTFSGSEGSQPFLAYLIDMNWLFEKYVGALVSSEAPKWQTRASEQDPHPLDVHRMANVKPDVVLYRHDKPELVIDAKYKLDEHQSDVYQVIAYCHALGINRGVLVHPATEGIARKTLDILGPGGFSIYYVPLELGGGPELLKEHAAEMASHLQALLPEAD